MRPLSRLAEVVVNLLMWGLAVASIGLVFARRHASRSELTQWHRASDRLNRICPPTDSTATVWCKIVDEPTAARNEVDLDAPAAQQPAAVQQPADVGVHAA
jgi:hypothetical protein